MESLGFSIPGAGMPGLNQQEQQRKQHSQAYGNILPDGLPLVQPLPLDYSRQLYSDPQDQMAIDDPQDSKRRRIARACDMCRKKKIKCDGKMPACTQCLNYKTECIFTQVEKKRAPPKGAKYIEGLENRLSRMEHLLRLSGLLGEDEDSDLGVLEKKLMQMRRESGQDSTTALSAPSSPTLVPSTNEGTDSPPRSLDARSDVSKTRTSLSVDEGRKSFGSDDPKAETEEQVESLSEMMCSLVTNNTGETRYIGLAFLVLVISTPAYLILGSSSGFSIFSPKGIEWVNSKTGDGSFQTMITEVSVDDHKWTNWKPEVFADVFRRPVFRHLPPKEEALSLLQDYFENFNCMCPLFHQPTFMHLVERQYSSDPYQGSGWWASLNCALAISHRLRFMSNLGSEDEDARAWGHIKNALGVYSELTMRNTDLLSVQALTGMALFMQGTPNPQPSFLLVAAAIRLSHTIGLHKRGTGFNLNPIEIEQRKRVFWIAYMLDKDLCLRAGRPPAQDDDDMNVDLPDEDPLDCIGNIPLADGKGKMNLFRVMCEFSVIESNVYKRLYATKAAKQSDGELLSAIGELDQQLEDWKNKIPTDFRPEHEIRASHTPLIIHVVMLHFAYYNCLTTIHRMSVHHGFWTSRLSNYALQGLNTRALNPRVYSSASLCTGAARASISLLKYMPQGDFNCVWMILYFPVSALMTLFANILNNPLDPKVKSDIRLMNLVVNFLSMLGQEAEQGGVHRMLGVCSEFERIAKIVVEKAEKEPRRKRKNADESTKGTPSAASDASMTSAPTLSASMSDQTKPTPRTTVASTPTPAASSTEPINTEDRTPPYSKHGHDEPSHILGTGFGASADPSISANWPNDFSLLGSGGFEAFGDPSGFSSGAEIPGSDPGAPFAQPLLPQDLFSLPMTLDWNWAELSGGAYPTVENGMFGGNMQGQREQ
ncbi:unnamed protein product [Clonostachys byssicola]|uniref:Zn(2)-C6 fungal-type domain-containing protein n=1 Tax=Clonostachys byssicola TaxID=160290 RepID=A0A9N9UU97_9HYPO|nr:unnamed protein product [Clonostachys byssicola]